MGSRLDGPEERKKDLDKRYDPTGGGKNPFRPTFPPTPRAKTKATQKTKVAKKKRKPVRKTRAA